MKRRGLTRRAVAERERRQREERPTRHYAEQHSRGFVPPPPEIQTRNRLTHDVLSAGASALNAGVALDSLIATGNQLALLRGLRNGTAQLPDVHRDDRAGVARDALAATDDPMHVEGVLARVTNEYVVRRRVVKLSRKLGQELAATFRWARVAPAAGGYWIVAQFIRQDRQLDEVQAERIVNLLGLTVTRQSVHEAVTHAEALLRQAGLLDQARAAVAKQADAWPLGDDAYDRMIGPWAPGGGRSVDSTPVEAPGDVAERRGRRAFNPLRIKKMHEST